MNCDEVIEFVKKFMEYCVFDSIGKLFSLEDVWFIVWKIVMSEVEKYVVDGIGWIDYVLVSGGGCVVDYLEGVFLG